MATGRLAIVLKSRGEFGDEEIARMTENDAWQWLYGHAETPESGRSEDDEAEIRH